MIVAWAEGYEIEYLCLWSRKWFFIAHPSWSPYTKYRIKPQKTDKEIQIEELESTVKESQKKLDEALAKIEKLKGE
jgi:hypothetical protein